MFVFSCRLRDQLLSFLRVQQAEALTLQHHSKIAQIDEVMRCVNALDDAGCKHVFKVLLSSIMPLLGIFWECTPLFEILKV